MLLQSLRHHDMRRLHVKREWENLYNVIQEYLVIGIVGLLFQFHFQLQFHIKKTYRKACVYKYKNKYIRRKVYKQKATTNIDAKYHHDNRHHLKLIIIYYLYNILFYVFIKFISGGCGIGRLLGVTMHGEQQQQHRWWACVNTEEALQFKLRAHIIYIKSKAHLKTK